MWRRQGCSVGKSSRRGSWPLWLFQLRSQTCEKDHLGSLKLLWNFQMTRLHDHAEQSHRCWVLPKLPDYKQVNDKDPEAGKDWGQEEKVMTEDEMVGWYHRLDGHGCEWTLGVGDGPGGLTCCGSWGRKESDTTEWLNWTELKWLCFKSLSFGTSSYPTMETDVCANDFCKIIILMARLRI